MAAVRRGGGTHSPCASLKMFFLRSVMESDPSAFHIPMSPVWSQPLESRVSFVSFSFLK